MELKFFSIDEVKDFVKQLKGTRGGKNEPEDGAQAGAAPPPAPVPQGGAQGFPGVGFAPPAAGATTGGVFPAAAAPTVDPAVTALIQRISTRIKGAIASGQPADAARSWLAGQCGPECAAYTLEQLETIAMPKLSVPALENIAKLMAA